MATLLLYAMVLLSPALCDEISNRIIGGAPVNIADYPYMLSMRLTGSHHCGASLISNTRAVTVAHCSGSAAGAYNLLGGTSDRTDTSCATCVLRDLTNIDIHPGYDENGNGYPNDVAVLSFAAVAYNANLQPIVLSTPADGDFAGDACSIAGWGVTQQGGPLPINLNAADVTVMTNAACAAEWGAAAINAGHVCVTGGTPCNGDDGGPLECSNILVGLGSWGHSTCSILFPSVYTRASYFYSWIIAQ